MALNITVTDETDSTLRLNLDGSLDSDTYAQLESLLASKVTDHTKLVAMNLADLKFISSSGLRVFFKTIKQLKKNGGKVAVSHMQPGVKKVFEIVKALPDLSIFASVEELDAYLASFQR
ncbi:STAS domain-containing protein [Reinekea blandensis]|uniref:Anti-sigma factor antagonist n=1 Tax=Reinekea blandensis MED297 TaxID=314283 RepID=A4BH97_9GAMM|nr:STAS domain-containing protein [Reinekea blandensis]EAR08445.1 anti-sigma F factor antagonist [Reinekea sp. MED297] [Reinekea blandensis MED297]